MNKKKVLHISTYYYPSLGGIEQVAQDTVNALGEDFEQKVICFSTNGQDSYENYDGHQVVKVGTKLKVRSQAISLRYFFHLYKLISRDQFNFIHFHAPNPLISLYLLACLHLNRYNGQLFVHWHSDIIEQKFLRRLYLPIQNLLLKRADAIIVTSDPAKISIELAKFDKKVVVIANSYNEKKMEMNADESHEALKLRAKYSEKLIFFIGRHVKYKGIHHLIAAAALRPDLHFVIAGKGPLTEQLKKSVNSANVEFIGSITDSQMRIYMAASSAFVLPSVSRNEAFGVVLAEANSVGTPTAVFRIEGSGVPWVVEQGITGYICDTFCPQKLAETIEKAAQLKADALSIQKRAQQRFSHSQVFVPAIQKLYQI